MIQPTVVLRRTDQSSPCDRQERRERTKTTHLWSAAVPSNRTDAQAARSWWLTLERVCGGGVVSRHGDLWPTSTNAFARRALKRKRRDKIGGRTVAVPPEHRFNFASSRLFPFPEIF